MARFGLEPRFADPVIVFQEEGKVGIFKYILFGLLQYYRVITKRGFEWAIKSALFADILVRNHVCPFIKRSRAEYSTVFLGNALQCFHNLYSQENFLTSKLNPFCCSFSVLVFRAL